jgi:hypothetical protein
VVQVRIYWALLGFTGICGAQNVVNCVVDRGVGWNETGSWVPRFQTVDFFPFFENISVEVYLKADSPWLVE